MGNQLAIQYHTNPGEEVLAHEESHVRSIEGGAAGVRRRGFPHCFG